jgi:hypothetical protein
MTLEQLLDKLSDEDRLKVELLHMRRPQLSVTALIAILKLTVEDVADEI